MYKYVLLPCSRVSPPYSLNPDSLPSTKPQHTKQTHVENWMGRDSALRAQYKLNQDAEHAVRHRGRGFEWTPQFENDLLRAARQYTTQHPTNEKINPE